MPAKGKTPETIPDPLAGKYIAWSPDGIHIMGHGDTIDEARENAGRIGGLIVQKVPESGHVRFVHGGS